MHAVIVVMLHRAKRSLRTGCPLMPMSIWIVVPLAADSKTNRTSVTPALLADNARTKMGSDTSASSSSRCKQIWRRTKSFGKQYPPPISTRNNLVVIDLAVEEARGEYCLVLSISQGNPHRRNKDVREITGPSSRAHGRESVITQNVLEKEEANEHWPSHKIPGENMADERNVEGRGWVGKGDWGERERERESERQGKKQRQREVVETRVNSPQLAALDQPFTLLLPPPPKYPTRAIHGHIFQLHGLNEVRPRAVIMFRGFISLQGNPDNAVFISEPDSFLDGIAPGFSHVGIVPDDTASFAAFLGNLPFTPFLHSGIAPYSPQSSSSSLKTSLPPCLNCSSRLRTTRQLIAHVYSFTPEAEYDLLAPHENDALQQKARKI
ncbi:hypothetical protein PR048_021122 [Dryococelus australis]|uniref:Uncharacterized protein n=1 Tax=Dryococelus australis TaxID=614101 RepID=A0ABQ9GXB6_9NEOP|nr:hypothetical protein PR048_021122 [Dryococelus australis]